MRLLTHNYLKSTVRGTEKGYPLGIEADKLQYEKSPFDPEFITALLSKIDYKIILFARRQIAEKCAAELSSEVSLPELPESIDYIMNTVENSDGHESGDHQEILRKLHTVMFDIHVVEGHLICPDTGRRFKITMGIPNMILHEDEI
mmetsp:Transcript_3797/g.5711  ORF Transcript_3797/g.5711 Transcript_3797/m.5711 type:complete len:146 (-) Transcript_3797:80-517(-)|eukprot:CAMPEP_0197255234 /NCGR_PEP_ID=MMETSP1429-20130617/71467_1 /TAXON_ID=49237 /ORGANISM="Chaetoceros  sp., Strain UNC1202" /LENGTH=145 /DNA_ID=CAMNT_0042718485 /DNA_START=72 /DNA_END=509 /DNA_ORIENTATION=+